MPQKDKDETPKEIKIVTEFDKDFRITTANYFFVGWTGASDMRIDFMIQSMPIPKQSTHELINDGRNIGEEILAKREPREVIERSAQVSVVLSIEGALLLSDLLKKQVDHYKKNIDTGK